MMTIRFQCLYTFKIYTIAFYIYVHYDIHKEVIHMTIINITNFKKNIFEYIRQTIKHNEPLSINTKDGNAVLLSEDDYVSLLETLYITSKSSMKERLLEGKNAPLSECISEEEVMRSLKKKN